MTSPLAPQIGDSVYLGSFLSNNHVFGVVSDLDTPDMASMSWEVSGGNGLLSVRALIGPPGPAGKPMFILKLQQQVFDDPDDLPKNLTTDDVDLGKYWVVREFDEDGNAVSSQGLRLVRHPVRMVPDGHRRPTRAGADHHPDRGAARPRRRRPRRRDPGHRRRLPPVLAHEAQGAARTTRPVRDHRLGPRRGRDAFRPSSAMRWCGTAPTGRPPPSAPSCPSSTPCPKRRSSTCRWPSAPRWRWARSSCRRRTGIASPTCRATCGSPAWSSTPTR